MLYSGADRAVVTVVSVCPRVIAGCTPATVPGMARPGHAGRAPSHFGFGRGED